MTYVRKHARFNILDDMPVDVWQEPEPEPTPRERIPRGPIITDPERYLCIVGEEPADYYGNFTACTFTAALYQGEHVAVSADYLRKSCTLADETTARKILAFYLRNWAAHEDDDAAELLRDEADRINKQA